MRITNQCKKRTYDKQDQKDKFEIETSYSGSQLAKEKNRNKFSKSMKFCDGSHRIHLKSLQHDYTRPKMPYTKKSERQEKVTAGLVTSIAPSTWQHNACPSTSPAAQKPRNARHRHPVTLTSNHSSNSLPNRASSFWPSSNPNRCRKNSFCDAQR